MIAGIPFEANRMDCDPAGIERYFDDLEQILVDFPCAMVVNVDETGHCNWVDARTQTVVVPCSYLKAEIPILVKRQTDRSILLAGIAANGDQWTRLVIIHRQTIETELSESGLTPDLVVSRNQESRFITTDLLNE